MPEGVQKNYFTREMQVRTATNRIQYTSYDLPCTLDNELNIEVLRRILSTRYLESIREREGGSYGVGTGGQLSHDPVPAAILLMQFDTDPDKQERLMLDYGSVFVHIMQRAPRAFYDIENLWSDGKVTEIADV